MAPCRQCRSAHCGNEVALPIDPPLLQCAPPGEVDEWFKSHAWKACLG